MELFDPKKLNFDWAAKFKTANFISLILVAVCAIAFFVPGLNYGIDFRGGVEAHVRFAGDKNVEVKDLRDLLDGKLLGLSVQKFSDAGAKDFLIVTQSDSKADVGTQLKTVLTGKYGEEGPASWQVAQLDSVGRKVGNDFKESAILSLLYTCLLIAAYIYLRFDFRFTPGALACVFHDLILTMGLLVLIRAEFTTTIVAALLTLAGYSINDTVVIFDRIREIEARFVGKSKAFIVNESINSTLSRTMMTATTTLMCCVVLYFLGGPTLKDFAFTLFFGIIIGTYSSIFVASPLYVWADAKFGHHGQIKVEPLKAKV
jgi:preprotein translocase subunit SecF